MASPRTKDPMQAAYEGILDPLRNGRGNKITKKFDAF
jgi:hypothetical protein